MPLHILFIFDWLHVCLLLTLMVFALFFSFQYWGFISKPLACWAHTPSLSSWPISSYVRLLLTFSDTRVLRLAAVNRSYRLGAARKLEIAGHVVSPSSSGS